MSRIFERQRTLAGARRRTWKRIAALVWAWVTLAAWAGGCGPASSPSAAHGVPSASAERYRGVGFRTLALLDEHYRKHGREFGRISRDQYLHIAQALRDRAAGGEVLEFVREDGVVTRFDRGTGTFLAFNTDGVIRTCFRPTDGERYFRRQAARYEGER